ncbi:hypothetical protein [Cellulomonas fimi]|uniref:Uncharacterized protein n=1 Tax=Cellulomonas fimi TaxID=1708 RepID=A0A7Y0QJN6_CELFI|nr:hypothetical protein [Cellulomonas fimi]NMR21542.1 hypothetical protein [Cellulomonas fimi]
MASARRSFAVALATTLSLTAGAMGAAAASGPPLRVVEASHQGAEPNARAQAAVSAKLRKSLTLPPVPADVAAEASRLTEAYLDDDRFSAVEV